MELAIGIIIGVLIILALGKLNQYNKERERRVEKMEQVIHEQYHSIMNDLMDMQEKIILFESKLKDIKSDSNRVKKLEEELVFEKKSNGLNFQKLIKDVMKIKEHMTWMSQPKER